MNREIKFRVWDTTTETMFDWEFLQAARELALASGLTEKRFIVLPNRDVDVLMQYIGIKDVDGADIYEGDIVEGTEGELSGEIWQVVREVCDDFNGWSVQPSDRARVIGNIYQNEELLP